MKVRVNPKTFFVASGVIAVLGAGAMYMAYTSLGDTEVKVAALRKDAKDEKQVQTQLEKTGIQIEELRSKLKHLELGVPQFAYIPTMTKELETVGRSHGIEVLGIRPMPAPAADKKAEGEKPPRKAYEELVIQVKGRGSYGSVMRFVQSLTRFPKIVEVRMLTLSPKIDTKTPLASPQLDAEIEMRAYAFKDAAPDASVDPALTDEDATKVAPSKKSPAKPAAKVALERKEGSHES